MLVKCKKRTTEVNFNGMKTDKEDFLCTSLELYPLRLFKFLKKEL